MDGERTVDPGLSMGSASNCCREEASRGVWFPKTHNRKTDRSDKAPRKCVRFRVRSLCLKDLRRSPHKPHARIHNPVTFQEEVWEGDIGRDSRDRLSRSPRTRCLRNVSGAARSRSVGTVPLYDSVRCRYGFLATTFNPDRLTHKLYVLESGAILPAMDCWRGAL